MENCKSEIKISVRNLVEFILRCGDIDSQFAGSKRALEGSRLHRKIQKSQDSNYTAEVSLKHTIESANFILIIDGRVDGIIEQEDGSFCIDEIKTTSRDLNLLSENSYPLHWAQAQCYAYIFAIQKNLSSISIQLTYCEVETEKLKRFYKNFNINELLMFFNDLIDQYLKWAEMSHEWAISRNNSIKELTFPFNRYRPGQRELAVSTYKTITSMGKLFVNAPTGIGKTVSTLFPSIKAIGEGFIKKVFYLTAKTITRSVAEEALSLMRQQKVRIKTITLYAKEKICFNDEVICQPSSCKYASGHFDRVNAALWELINNHDELNRETIEYYAQKFRVCPFEFSLDCTLFCDIIICDYNYVFDPNVYLKRFFTENGGEYTFLIDEAHNLVDRSRDMFSSVLKKTQLSTVKKVCKTTTPEVYKALNRLILQINSLKKAHPGLNTVKLPAIPESLDISIRHMVNECEKYLVKNSSTKNDDILQLYFDALFFIKIIELYDEHYITILDCVDKEISIKLFCIDPSYLLSESLKRGKSSIFFSATLSPLSYYREILGGSKDDCCISLGSPFDIKNRCLLLTTDISTRFNHRETSIESIISCIRDIIDHRPGNYLVFFPSYSYMNSIVQTFSERHPLIKSIVQNSSMSETEREAFLQQFQPAPDSTTVGFCVLGGLFSEGIDLKNDRLIGAIIIGVGLPQICAERDYIREYFQLKNNHGYEYAYVYPGMNKVLQAAGRVIRSETDKGVIVLIDDRFCSAAYQRLFPKDWFPHKKIHSSRIKVCIKDFWDTSDVF